LGARTNPRQGIFWLLAIASHAKPGTDQANARLDAVRCLAPELLLTAYRLVAPLVDGVAVPFRAGLRLEVSDALHGDVRRDQRVTPGGPLPGRHGWVTGSGAIAASTIPSRS
jgi:hypothetical protein